MPSAFSGISSFLVSTFIALFILYFVLAEWDVLCAWVGSHLGVPSRLGQGIVEDATRSFRDYFYVLTLSSLPVAIIVGLTAVVLGVPLAFTIGLITFVTSYVPYLGALVSSVFALLIAFGSGGIVPALIMLVVILVAQNVVQPILQRQLERSALDLHPIVSLRLDHHRLGAGRRPGRHALSSDGGDGAASARPYPGVRGRRDR